MFSDTVMQTLEVWTERVVGLSDLDIGGEGLKREEAWWGGGYLHASFGGRGESS